jgi:hypothetical protein
VKEPEVIPEPNHHFTEAMGDLITDMSHFDENMKLKLQLNLELVQQDDKVWSKYGQV